MRIAFHVSLALVLTALTQIGGLAWLAALASKRRLVAFTGLYIVLFAATIVLAPIFGREPLPCIKDGPLRVQSPIFCLMNRHYVSPELAALARDFAAAMEREHPGTKTRVLDAGFPFFDGFPLLPHLSHDDGRKIDFAFYYSDSDIYRPGATRSPVGYFAYQAGPSPCPDGTMSLRWDLSPLQPLWRDLALEPKRMRAALAWLNGDTRVGKVFVEPHILSQLGLSGSKLRFQGCAAARHDDHFHVQL